jgi:hypothetical protein
VLDGAPDLASPDTGLVNALLNDGNGIFPSTLNYIAGANTVSVAAADLNDDGRADRATANSFSGTVSVLLTQCLP